MKRVTSSDDGTVEDPENENTNEGGENTGNGENGGSNTNNTNPTNGDDDEIPGSGGGNG
ncbi:MAG: hypothetical protein J6T38_05290 [Bacteroidaceae bacterium]|nr:hypothetical protein [Bacteroidaceae bacterium]